MIPILFLSLVLAKAGGLSNPNSTAKTYIIHMDSAKVSSMEHSLGGSRRWHEFIFDSLHEEQEDEEPELLYVYSTAISGFAAKLTPRQVASIKELDGFISAHPDKLLSLHTTRSPGFLGLKPDSGLWSTANSFPDVIIGFIDTGIWPEHASFRDSDLPPIPPRWKGTCEGSPRFPCNRKIIGARAFWKGYDAIIGDRSDGRSTKTFQSARDWYGHGTHTASIAAGSRVSPASLFGHANGSASGMHSAARIAAYKVCWSDSCAESDVTAAIDQAVDDGIDVLSISLGAGDSTFASPSLDMDAVAVATFGAVQKGVFVACSGGNSGPKESTVVNSAPWVMTVAASYIDRSFPALVKLGDDQRFVGASIHTRMKNRTGDLPIAYDPGSASRYCLPGTLVSAKGCLVACDSDSNDPSIKEEEVNRAGGAGMILLNREDQGEELLAGAHVIPVSTLGAAAATAIKGYCRSSIRPTASIYFMGTAYGTTAPMIAAFSSRGPSLSMPSVVKPDVTAPGANILGAWSPSASPSSVMSDRRKVPFNVDSGTSMSCPHVSGLAALLKSIHSDWSPAVIKSALMTTAYARDNRNSSIVDVSNGLPATPFAFGSGHVDPERAAHPGLVYDIDPNDYLCFMCVTMGYTSSQVSVVARKQYSCANCRGDSSVRWGLNYPTFSVLFHRGNRNQTVVQWRTATNVGQGRCDYKAKVSEPDGVAVAVHPSVLAFTRTGEKLDYNVTFVSIAAGRKAVGYSFGELAWVCGNFSVRSPVAVTWGYRRWPI